MKSPRDGGEEERKVERERLDETIINEAWNFRTAWCLVDRVLKSRVSVWGGTEEKVCAFGAIVYLCNVDRIGSGKLFFWLCGMGGWVKCTVHF